MHHFLLPRSADSAFSPSTTTRPGTCLKFPRCCRLGGWHSPSAHKQPVPPSPPFTLSLPKTSVGDAADSTAAEPLAVAVPPRPVPHVPLGGLAAAGYLLGLCASLLPWAGPSTVGRLFCGAAINSTTADISLRYWAGPSNQSLIATSLCRVNSPKGKRGEKREQELPLPHRRWLVRNTG